MRYSITKTLKKGSEPSAVIIGLSALIIMIMRSNGVDIEEKEVAIVGALCTGFFGLCKSIINYFKNRRNF